MATYVCPGCEYTYDEDAGEYVFTGRTKDGLIRRTVIAFDVAGTIPAGSTINTVTLQLVVSRVANNTLRLTTVHRATADWGEGTSNAAQNEGEGAPSTTGDATWIHRFYPGSPWSVTGGDFDASAHANSRKRTSVTSPSRRAAERRTAASGNDRRSSAPGRAIHAGRGSGGAQVFATMRGQR